MKKLDDIPKKNLFTVPEGYFDKLPGVIQSRVAEREATPGYLPYLRFSVRYALPILVLGVAAFFWVTGRTSNTSNTEQMLSGIETVDLVAYLDESDVTTEELIDNLEFSDGDLDDMETEVYSPGIEDNELEQLKNELDEQNL